MEDAWRFRPSQSGICPVCSTSHYPFCTPPPVFGYSTGDPYRRFDPTPPPFHRPIHDPPPSYPAREPNPLPQFLPNPYLHDEFTERDGFRKRMRVEDPYPMPPPPQRVSMDDERRLSLIREHGRQITAPISDQHTQHRQANDFQRPLIFDRVLPPERRDFYVGELEDVRNGPYSSEIGSSWSRLEEKYLNRVPDDRHFVDPQPPFVHDPQLYPSESSSYSLPRQPQYPHSESYRYPERYHVMPKRDSDEQESHYISSYATLRPPLESNVEYQNQQKTHFGYHLEQKPSFLEETRRPFEPRVDPTPYGSDDYRMDSAMIGRVQNSQMRPPLPPQPPLPQPPEPSPPQYFQEPFIPKSPPMPSPAPAMTSAPLFPTQPTTSAPLFPAQPTVSAPLFPTQSTALSPLFPTPPTSQGSLESCTPIQSNFYNEKAGHNSTVFVSEV